MICMDNGVSPGGAGRPGSVHRPTFVLEASATYGEPQLIQQWACLPSFAGVQQGRRKTRGAITPLVTETARSRSSMRLRKPASYGSLVRWTFHEPESGISFLQACRLGQPADDGSAAPPAFDCHMRAPPWPLALVH